MILTKKQQKEFAKASDPLIKFIANNCHPHVKVIVKCNSAELLESISSLENNKHLKD